MEELKEIFGIFHWFLHLHFKIQYLSLQRCKARRYVESKWYPWLWDENDSGKPDLEQEEVLQISWLIYFIYHFIYTYTHTHIAMSTYLDICTCIYK